MPPRATRAMRGRHAAPGSTELQEELTTPVEFGRFISNGTEKCRIWKYTNHVPSSLAVDPGCHVKAGDTLRLEMKGSTLQFYLNGVVRLTATDTAWTAGNPGYEFVHNVNGSPVLDNWGGGNLLDPTCVGSCSSRKGKK